MDRIENAAQYATEFAKINRAKMIRRIDPNSERLAFLIGYLYMNDTKTVYSGELAKVSCVSTARIAAALKALEQQGLITRTLSEKDSRKTIVSLTESGRQHAEESRLQMLGRFADMIDLVGEEDMKEFLRISQKISNALVQICEKGADHV